MKLQSSQAVDFQSTCASIFTINILMGLDMRWSCPAELSICVHTGCSSRVPWCHVMEMAAVCRFWWVTQNTAPRALRTLR